MERRAQKTGIGTRLSRLLDRARGVPVEWDLGAYEADLTRIDARARELGLASIADGLLRDLAVALREKARGEGLGRGDVLEGFALVREVSARVLGMRHFDVQTIAGLALEAGRVVEMQTGEGKTLVAVMPAVLGALGGGGVHVLTFNDYLASRDADWMGDVYRFFGLEVACVTGGMGPPERRSAYLADVTYLTAREAGYDLLRDQLAREVSLRVLRPFHMAIVDEADSIMIDEARVPLVLAGSQEGSSEAARVRLAGLVADLAEGVDYKVDEGARNAFLTDEGQESIQRSLGCGDLYGGDNGELATRINQALHARALLRRGIDYILVDGRVEIVDEFTGRTVPDRHWPDGLHRAVEAKEGLAIAQQGTVLSSISMQHLIRLYPRLCGMTGTVFPSQEEMSEFYGLVTTPIPPNRECVRLERPDILFADAEGKERAVVEEVARENGRGRPVLVGTASVEESESLAATLRGRGIECNVLNAANDALEAAIVAEAGAAGAVTVSTNMAGRGTDIRLGGANGATREQVLRAGGLCVIGTSRFESRRVDDQLRGRAGRQGDPGEARFFVSLEDDLMKRFDAARWIPRST